MTRWGEPVIFVVGEGGATIVPVVEVEVAGESRVAVLVDGTIPESLPLLLLLLPERTRRGSAKFCCSESSCGVIVL